eukprot:8409106-Pyramimonas_sp.AAC.1
MVRETCQGPPRKPSFSSSTTLAPRSNRASAADSPASPPPMTTASTLASAAPAPAQPPAGHPCAHGGYLAATPILRLPPFQSQRASSYQHDTAKFLRCPCRALPTCSGRRRRHRGGRAEVAKGVARESGAVRVGVMLCQQQQPGVPGESRVHQRVLRRGGHLPRPRQPGHRANLAPTQRESSYSTIELFHV